MEGVLIYQSLVQEVFGVECNPVVRMFALI